RISLEIDGKIRQTLVINGDRGWQSLAGETAELPKPRLEEMREEAYALWVANLTPLKKDEFTLALLANEDVLDRPCFVVKVTAKGHQDTRLFFDKESGLLTKVARQVKQGGLQVVKEFNYGDFKEFEGARLPTRITETVGGRKF